MWRRLYNGVLLSKKDWWRDIFPKMFKTKRIYQKLQKKCTEYFPNPSMLWSFYLFQSIFVNGHRKMQPWWRWYLNDNYRTARASNIGSKNELDIWFFFFLHRTQTFSQAEALIDLHWFGCIGCDGWRLEKEKHEKKVAVCVK